MFNAEGRNLGWENSDDYALLPPKLPGRIEYDALNTGIHDLIGLTFTTGKKIAGIKALRSILNLGLTDAKLLWEQLADEHRADRRNSYLYA